MSERYGTVELIDGAISIRHVRLDHGDWNGWAMPRFTSQQVDELIRQEAWVNAYVVTTDGVVQRHGDRVQVRRDVEDEVCVVEYEPDDNGLYAVGSRDWTWECYDVRVVDTPPDPDWDPRSPDRFTGQDALDQGWVWWPKGDPSSALPLWDIAYGEWKRHPSIWGDGMAEDDAVFARFENFTSPNVREVLVKNTREDASPLSPADCGDLQVVAPVTITSEGYELTDTHHQDWFQNFWEGALGARDGQIFRVYGRGGFTHRIELFGMAIWKRAGIRFPHPLEDWRFVAEVDESTLGSNLPRFRMGQDQVERYVEAIGDPTWAVLESDVLTLKHDGTTRILKDADGLYDFSRAGIPITMDPAWTGQDDPEDTLNAYVYVTPWPEIKPIDPSRVTEGPVRVTHHSDGSMSIAEDPMNGTGGKEV